MVVLLTIEKKTYDLHAHNYARVGTAHCGLRYGLTIDNIVVSALYYAGVTNFLQLYYRRCHLGVHTFSPPMWLQEMIPLF